MQNYVVFKYFRDLVFDTALHAVNNIMNLIINTILYNNILSNINIDIA